MDELWNIYKFWQSTLAMHSYGLAYSYDSEYGLCLHTCPYDTHPSHVASPYKVMCDDGKPHHLLKHTTNYIKSYFSSNHFELCHRLCCNTSTNAAYQQWQLFSLKHLADCIHVKAKDLAKVVVNDMVQFASNAHLAIIACVLGDRRSPINNIYRGHEKKQISLVNKNETFEELAIRVDLEQPNILESSLTF